LDTTLLVITLGSFVASFVNGAFATGGVYILLASSSAVLPLTAAVPLQSAFGFVSLVSRVGFFWKSIQWPIVIAFVCGAVIGVGLGTSLFVSLNESSIALLLGSVLLLLTWFPILKSKSPFKHPFFLVGTLHSFISTLFGIGALLQPILIRSQLLKAQITATLAACLVSMEVMKITGYVHYGFNYVDYLPHIVMASVMGFLGTWLGKRITHHVSEQAFRLVFRWLISIVALRLLYRGWVLSA
jgi:uncharacterized membrane protein YfcA